MLNFYDAENGAPLTYPLTGNPGLKASLEDSIQSRVGDVVAIPLHDKVTGSGSGTTYRITQVRFGRVMHVKLKGSSADRGLWFQPVIYTGPGVLFNSAAPSSGGAAGRILLAR